MEDRLRQLRSHQGCGNGRSADGGGWTRMLVTEVKEVVGFWSFLGDAAGIC